MNKTGLNHKLILSFGYFLSILISGGFAFNTHISPDGKSTEKDKQVYFLSSMEVFSPSSDLEEDLNYLPLLALAGFSLLLIGLPLAFWHRNQQPNNSKEAPIDPASVFLIQSNNEVQIGQNNTDILKQLVNRSATGIPEKHANTLIDQGKVEPILVDLLYKTLQPDLLPNNIRNPQNIHSESTHMDQVFLKKIFSIIEENLSNEQLSLTLLSELAGISVTHLNRKLKSLIGVPGGKLIRSIRLNKAAKILTDQSMTISEVAYLMGFQEPTHFTRSFKKQFGVPPSQYIKQ